MFQDSIRSIHIILSVINLIEHLCQCVWPPLIILSHIAAYLRLLNRRIGICFVLENGSFVVSPGAFTGNFYHCFREGRLSPCILVHTSFWETGRKGRLVQAHLFSFLEFLIWKAVKILCLALEICRLNHSLFSTLKRTFFLRVVGTTFFLLLDFVFILRCIFNLIFWGAFTPARIYAEAY